VVVGGWYEAYMVGSPSTNNSLEATNRWIKSSNTLRERLPLQQFFQVAKEIVSGWSREHDPSNINHKVFIGHQGEDLVDTKLWTDGYQFAKEKREIRESNGLYYIASKALRQEDLESCFERRERLQLLRKPRQFDDLIEVCNSIYIISDMTHENPLQAKCTCRVNTKKHLCKHIIGLGIQLHHLKAPPQAKNVPIGQKRPRGRPSKAKKAKIVQ